MAEIEIVPKPTKKGLIRAERNRAIVAYYQELLEKYPDVKSERIFAGIAEKYKMTSASIRSICKKEGVYVSR